MLKTARILVESGMWSGQTKEEICDELESAMQFTFQAKSEAKLLLLSGKVLLDQLSMPKTQKALSEKYLEYSRILDTDLKTFHFDDIQQINREITDLKNKIEENLVNKIVILRSDPCVGKNMQQIEENTRF